MSSHGSTSGSPARSKLCAASRRARRSRRSTTRSCSSTRCSPSGSLGSAATRRPARANPSTRIAAMDVDVAVLGGGPGGYTAAIRAAQLGASVACVEQEPELGGTCLRVGCIPTKAWVQTAAYLHAAHETFAKLGVKTGEPELDFGAANDWKNGVVKQMTGGVAS